MHGTGQNWENLLVANGQNIIKLIYFKLCSKELWKKCLHNKLQNANECFNGVILPRVSRRGFICLKTVKFGVYDTVIQFNEDYQGCLKVLTDKNSLKIQGISPWQVINSWQARIGGLESNMTPVAHKM